MEPLDTTQLTPDQIANAVSYMEKARAKEREKYQRNKEHRLSYAKQYYQQNKAAILEKARARKANPPALPEAAQ